MTASAPVCHQTQICYSCCLELVWILQKYKEPMSRYSELSRAVGLLYKYKTDTEKVEIKLNIKSNPNQHQ